MLRYILPFLNRFHLLGKYIIKPITIKLGRRTYSQFGEDVLLKHIFYSYWTRDRKGFYVDVGAHHPYDISNTAYFHYLKGWKGINIEPSPFLFKRFKQYRKKDINLNIGISEKEAKLKLYRHINEEACNSFIPPKDSKKFKRTEIIEINTYPLKDILDKYLPANQTIHFMSIDTEGYDMNVLRSNDWKKYRPIIVVIENHNINLDKTEDNEMCVFMKKQGYQLISIISVNLVFQDKKNINFSPK